MTTSSRFRSLATAVRYWLEDHGFGLAMGGAVVFIGGIMAWGTSLSMQAGTYDARITGLEASAAHSEEGTSCNGDPVLLICSETTVEVPAYYTVELTYTGPAAEDHSDWRDTCGLEVSAEEFAALEEGMVIPVTYRGWDGCGVKDWTPAAE